MSRTNHDHCSASVITQIMHRAGIGQRPTQRRTGENLKTSPLELSCKLHLYLLESTQNKAVPGQTDRRQVWVCK